jgi:hypothetical protein
VTVRGRDDAQASLKDDAGNHTDEVAGLRRNNNNIEMDLI